MPSISQGDLIKVYIHLVHIASWEVPFIFMINIDNNSYINLHLSFVFESCTHCLEMLAFEFHEWWCILVYSTFYCTHAMHLTLILAQMPTGLSHPAIFNTVQRKPTAQETLKRLFYEECPSVWLFLWRLLQFRESYQCFGQDTVVAIVGEPQGPAFLPRARVQTCTAVARCRNSNWESGAGVHWRSNTQSKPGELQLWWKELRLWGSFPSEWVHVFSPQKNRQPPTALQTLIAVYEKICLYPQPSLEPFIILNLVPGCLVRLFWDCFPFEMLSQLLSRLRVSLGYWKHCFMYFTITHRENERQPQTNVCL